jgi:hypothetical protein
MKEFYKAKAERLQSQINRIGFAYSEAKTYEEFSDTVYDILMEDEDD